MPTAIPLQPSTPIVSIKYSIKTATVITNEIIRNTYKIAVSAVRAQFLVSGS